MCTSDGSQAVGQPATRGSDACNSGNVTGTALDHATCVVVEVLLAENNLVGPLDALDPLTSERALCGLPFLQRLDLSANELSGQLPALQSCLPQLTHIDVTHKFERTLFNLFDTRGLTGPIPEWLLARIESDRMTTLHLAHNAFDDPTAEVSATTIRRLWQQCSTRLTCTGVPPIACSAFDRPGERYEVELTGLECVRCPTDLEVIGIGSAILGVVLLFGRAILLYTRLMRRYPEYAKTHGTIASAMCNCCRHAEH